MRPYRVRRGDSLVKVARRFRVSVSQLRRLNPELQRLRPGHRILVPAHYRYRFCQLTDGPGYKVRDAERAWGTLLAVTRLQDVMSAYARRFPEADPAWIHDLSHRRGGRMHPHRSHRTGRDVDIRVPLNYRTDRYVKASVRTIDLERTWYLFRTLIDTGDVEHIFIDRRLQVALHRHARAQGISAEELSGIFQYPRPQPKKCKSGRRCRRPFRITIVRHERGHSDHFHVRFRREDRQRVPVI